MPPLLGMAGNELATSALLRREVVRALARLCSSAEHGPALHRQGCLNVLLLLLHDFPLLLALLPLLISLLLDSSLLTTLINVMDAAP